MRTSRFLSAGVGITIAAGCMMIGVSADAAGQSFYGGIRGTARDAQGVIPAVRLTGYKTFERRGLIVGTLEFLTQDVTLDVGTIQEEVTVTGETPIVHHADASTGQVLDKKTLNLLPNHGRNAFVVAAVMPGVVLLGDPKFDRQQDQTNGASISMGGAQMYTNNFLLDGVPITDLRGRVSAIPTIEALAEVKVQVHTYDAEMAGREPVCSTQQRDPATTPFMGPRSIRRGLSGVTRGSNSVMSMRPLAAL
jgi:hypothetical protein